MSDDAVWAVVDTAYDSGDTIGVFELRQDAEVIASRLTSAPGDRWGGVCVEQIPFYRAGDTSLQPVTYYTHRVDVVWPDWTIKDVDIAPYAHSVLESDRIPPTGGVTVLAGRYCVEGVGATQEQARERAHSRASQVAALASSQGLDRVNAVLAAKRQEEVWGE